MSDITKNELDELLNKYKNKLSSSLNVNDKTSININEPQRVSSQEYTEFKEQYREKKTTYYEKLCAISEKYIKFKPSKTTEEILNSAIETCHLNVTPTGVNSLPYLVFISLLLCGILFGYMVPFILTGGEFTSMFFVIFSLIIGVVVLVPLGKIPIFMAGEWKMKASNQMVLATFYIVTYMRHTSNLELAIDFASEHLAPPLSFDFKRIVWNIETGKYESIKDSLDAYLEGWKATNMEFVESMHLIMSSLYESSEERRVSALDKSLEVILEETYEKMLKYAHELKGPMTMITMLGVILPILTLVIAPLAINFMGGIEWYHLAAFYNVALPFGVYYLSKIALSTRPGGGAQIDIGDDAELKKSQIITILGQKFTPFSLSVTLGVILLIIAISPQLIHLVAPGFDFNLGAEGKEIYFLEYKEMEGKIVGPFGFFSSLISLLLPISLAIPVGLYFRYKSQKVKEIRERVKKLESEFSSALFQLGNRLGDGLPAEIAFGKVAQLMENTVTGDFFKEVSSKISKLGMSIEMAIFDPRVGALKDFPSNLIESSMKVLSESSKKGPQIASQALINVSNYIKEMHRVDERVKDLMEEVLSSIKGQISFLAPTLTGIVVGITSMIGTIMGKLGTMKGIAGDSGQGMGMLSEMFKSGIPTYYFQAVVGLYVVQLVYVLTVMANTIENGKDKDGERYSLGVNMIKSVILYAGITFCVMVLFNLIGVSMLADV